MPRTARFIESNGYYHIISRSLNETHIFKDTNDFCYFLKLAHSAKQKYPIRILHYVIMSTHFHLAVQAPFHRILSQYIASIKWHYSMWMRKKYNWSGPLWRERYKSLPIENENYLYNCGMYIENNPVRAGICTSPSEYIYSSFHKYHTGTKNVLIDNYETIFDLKQALQVDYTANIAKNIFSFSPAIGSNSFINKFKCLSQK
jgi:putative transposase